MSYKRNNEFIKRNIMDKDYLFPTGSKQQSFQGAIVLDEVSLFIWESLSEEKTIEKLADEVSTEFIVDYDTALVDISELLAQFKEYEIVLDLG